jgi:hypothetical protein
LFPDASNHRASFLVAFIATSLTVIPPRAVKLELPPALQPPLQKRLFLNLESSGILFYFFGFWPAQFSSWAWKNIFQTSDWKFYDSLYARPLIKIFLPLYCEIQPWAVVIPPTWKFLAMGCCDSSNLEVSGYGLL